MPQRHAAAACGGENVSPQISIHNGPPGTVGYVLLMDEPDAGDAVHWAAWNIPADTASIPAGNPTGIGVVGKNVIPLIGMLAQLGDFALGAAEFTGTFGP